MIGATEPRRPRALMRLLIIVLALLIAWYLVTKVLSLFDYSIGRKTATMLTVRSGDQNVQVSLQGGEWQHAETSLRLYSGDAVAVRGSADAMLTFFDGTRVRLDQNADTKIERSDSIERGTSSLELNLRAGRIWIATPSILTNSGVIVRTIITKNASTQIPASTQAMIGTSMITVLKAAGEGLDVSIDGAENEHVIVGEGQYLRLTEETMQAIAAGTDPYDFRDPITQQMLKELFLTESYALLSLAPAPITGSGTAVSDEMNGTDLSVIKPENNARIVTKTVTVSGKVSNRVALVLVDGQSVPLNKDRTFSVDMSLGKEETMNLRIEAQDMQGITLDSIERTITNDYKPLVDPVRFKSPVASGGTLNTSLKEIEITGEAPTGAAAIMMNDYKLQLFKPGSKTWSYLASTALGNMIEGKNVYTVYVLDADGNRSQPRSITISFSFTGPATSTGSIEPPLKQNTPLMPGSLLVQTPAVGTETTTDQKEVILAGTTAPETYSVSINGYTLSLYLPGKTTWNYIASTDLTTMKRGRNVYRIVSRNKDGEILDVLEYTINFRP